MTDSTGSKKQGSPNKAGRQVLKVNGRRNVNSGRSWWPSAITIVLLILILTVSLGLRLYGVRWGVPEEPYWRAYHPDEGVAFHLLKGFYEDNDGLNPHYFINPSLHYYTIAGVHKGLSLLDVVPSFAEIRSVKAGKVVYNVTGFWLLARIISILLGTAVVVLVYLITLRLTGNIWAGLTAAAISSVNPAMVIQSHYCTVDGPVSFWYLLAFYFLLRSLDHPSWSQLALAGLLGGLATSVKYSGLLIVFPAAVVSILALMERGKKKEMVSTVGRAGLYATGLVVGFLAGCPYALLSFNEFRQGLSLLSSYNDYPVDLLYPWVTSLRLSLGWPIWAVCLFSLSSLIFKPKPKDAILLSTVIPGLLLLGLRASPYMRHIVILLPMVAVVIAVALNRWWGKTAVKNHGRLFLVLMSAMLLLGLSYATANSLAWVSLMAEKDNREAATDYVIQNLPHGTMVAVPSINVNYTPPIPQKLFQLVRLEYNQDMLLLLRPDYLMVTQYELVSPAYVNVSRKQHGEFFRQVGLNYRVLKEFKKTPACCGIKFEGYPATDWRYFYPTITIYERCLK